MFYLLFAAGFPFCSARALEHGESSNKVEIYGRGNGAEM